MGGNFASFAGQSIPYLVRTDLLGNPDTTFHTGLGPADAVYDLHILPNGKILIVGAFTHFTGIPVTRVCRLNHDGTLDATFVSPQVDSHVFSIDMSSNGNFYIGGAFTTINSKPSYGLALLDSLGSPVSSFQPQSTSIGGSLLTILALKNGCCRVGGNFSTFNGVKHKFHCQLNANGTINSATPDSTTSGVVNSIIMTSDGLQVIGGNFYYYRGMIQRGIKNWP